MSWVVSWLFPELLQCWFSLPQGGYSEDLGQSNESQYFPKTLFHCLTLSFSEKAEQSLPLLPSLSISCSPSSSPPLLALTLAALREEKQYIPNILCADVWTGLSGLTAAQWRKWHQFLPRVSKPGAFRIPPVPWSGTGASVGVLVYAFFWKERFLDNGAKVEIVSSCASLTLCLLHPGAANFGLWGRARENGGRRSVWDQWLHLEVFFSASAMVNTALSCCFCVNQLTSGHAGWQEEHADVCTQKAM